MRTTWAVVAGAAGIGSLAATGGILLAGERYAEGSRAATGWALAEMAALLVLTLLAVRLAPARPAVIGAGLSGVAVPAWLLRFGWGPVTPAALGGYAAWTVLALLAVAVGLYLRSLDQRRARSVSQARSAQRLQLARDLHDFVAHDISGMLAQAQAGQILADRDPAGAAAAFQRIEQAAAHALATMDNTVCRSWVLVQVLFEGVEAPRPVRAIGLQPLVDLGERFRAQRVQAPFAIGAHHDELGFAQHLEVFGHAGLAELEAFHQLSGGLLAVSQQVQDLPAMRLGHGGVRAHVIILPNGNMIPQPRMSPAWIEAPPGPDLTVTPAASGLTLSPHPATGR